MKAALGFACAACVALGVSALAEPLPQAPREDGIRGKTIRWTWSEGPVAGTTHEHVFHEDGTLLWRVVEGPQAGRSAREKEYAAVKVDDDVYAVSYLAASGYTLTVVLNFRQRRIVGFASNDTEWYPGSGTFEVLDLPCFPSRAVGTRTSTWKA